MKDELFGIGRGYLLLFLTVCLAGAMVFSGDISGADFLDSSKWLVPLGIAAKAADKKLNKT